LFLSLFHRHRSVGRSVVRDSFSFFFFFFLNNDRKKREKIPQLGTDIANFDISKLFFSLFLFLLLIFFSSLFLLQRLTNEFFFCSLSLVLGIIANRITAGVSTIATFFLILAIYVYPSCGLTFFSWNKRIHNGLFKRSSIGANTFNWNKYCSKFKCQ
jgi:hypothetical protein